MASIRFLKDDVEGLHQFCKKIVRPESVVIELGSYSGESAVIFAQYSKLVYCIDPWEDVVEVGATSDDSTFRYDEMAEIEARFDVNTQPLKNIIKIRAHSDRIVDMFGKGKADVVYIDSLHNYDHVRRDIDKWWPIVKPEGWIGGHNYGNYWPGVLKAVGESFDKPDLTFKDSSWAVKKTKRRRTDG